MEVRKLNDEIDSNKVVAVDEKVKHFASWAKRLVERLSNAPIIEVDRIDDMAVPAFRLWHERTGGDITEFLLAVQERLVMGSLKYGETWKFVDLEKELVAELYDIVCYEYLMDLKKKLGHWSQKKLAEKEGVKEHA